MLRGSDGQSLREYLIATAARLMAERGTAGLAVRDIAREAQVADGVLYNYFEDKEDLLAHALLAHVGSVMTSMAEMPEPGTATVAQNLAHFIDAGLAVLAAVTPAFAGLLAQPKVLNRFHAMIGGDAAFGAGPEHGTGTRHDAVDQIPSGPGEHTPEADLHIPEADRHPRGLPDLLTGYLRAEQRLGRIDPGADIDAAMTLVVGAIHGQVLPPLFFNPPGTPVTTPPGLAARLAVTVLSGVAPGQHANPASREEDGQPGKSP